MFLNRVIICSFALLMALPAAAQSGRGQTGIFGAGQPGEVSIVRMEARKLGLKNFQMESRQVNGRLAIDAFSANLGSGQMVGRGLVDWSRPDDQQHMTIQVHNVEVMELLRAFKVKLDAQILGMANAHIETRWRGTRGALPRQTMNGTVKIQVGPGRIVGADVLRQAASYTGINELQQVDFQAAELEGTIQNGVMSITSARFDGGHVTASGMGLLDLRTEEVNLKFDGYVSPDLLNRSTFPQVRALSAAARVAGNGGQVKVPMPVVMTGQVRDPRFELTWQNTDQAQATNK